MHGRVCNCSMLVIFFICVVRSNAVFTAYDGDDDDAAADDDDVHTHVSRCDYYIHI